MTIRHLLKQKGALTLTALIFNARRMNEQIHIPTDLRDDKRERLIRWITAARSNVESKAILRPIAKTGRPRWIEFRVMIRDGPPSLHFLVQTNVSNTEKMGKGRILRFKRRDALLTPPCSFPPSSIIVTVRFTSPDTAGRKLKSKDPLLD